MNRLKKTEKEVPGTSSFQQTFFKYIPYWHVFLPLLIISLTGAYFYLKFTTPQYESKASIMVKDPEKGQEDSQMEDLLNLFGGKNILENQLEILHSNSMISEVIENLKLYAPISEEKGWKDLMTRSAYFASPVLVEVDQPKKLKKVDKVYFDYVPQKKAVMAGGKEYALDKWNKTEWGMLRFTVNPNFRPDLYVDEERGRFYFSLIEVDKVANDLAKELQTTPTSKLSTVINLKLKDEVPERGEAILNELIRVYNQTAVNKKNAIANNTLKFISQRLSEVKDELDSLESGIQRYRANYNIVDISEQGKLYLQSMQNNDMDLSRMKMQMAALDEVDKYLEQSEKSGNIAPSTFNISDPALSGLLDKLSNSEIEFEKLRKNTGENNPKIISVQNEIAKLKKNITDNISNQRKSLAAGESTLVSNSSKYAALLNSIPKRERELVEASRQRNIKSDVYSFLLQKKEQASYSINSALPDSDLVDKATSSIYPVSPKKPLVLIIALIVPIGLGVSFVSLKESLNTKILYRQEIKKMSDFPIIGELLQEKTKEQLVTAGNERTFIKEQFRHIRNSLRNLGTPKGNVKRLLVTSSTAGEGKSFVASNLAVSLAVSGKKVALLELDLHKPRISSVFGIEDEAVGITDFLKDKATAHEIIFPTTLNANLFVLPAGTPDESPSELLINGKLEQLLKHLDTLFDIVVIDTAPVKPITDGYIIAPLCNLVLFVVRHNYTPKIHLQMLDEDMDMYNIKDVAIVFNGLKRRGVGKYSYGYGYGYGHDSKATYENYTKKKKKKIA